MKTLPADPEQAVLLNVLRTYFGADGGDHGGGPADWGRVTALAERQKVLQLVGHWARTREVPGIPEAAAEDLQDRYRRVLFRNLYLWDVLKDLLGRFEERGIKVLVFKGLVLARDYYGDLGLRRCVDVDLLVHPEEAERARAMLAEIGYRPLYRLNKQQERALARFQSLRSQSIDMYTRADGKAQADVHWRLGEHCYLPDFDEDLWGRARWGTLTADGGEEDSEAPAAAGAVNPPRYRSFSHEDTLLHLCAHGAQHRWEVLRYVADVAAVLHRHGASLDWGYIRDRVASAGRGRVVGVALALADDLVRAPFARPEENGIERDETTTELARDFARLLFGASPGRYARYGQMVRDLYGRSRWWLFSQVMHDVLTPTVLEVRLVTLPRPLWILYVPMRIVRLTWRDTVGRIRRRLRA